MSRKWVASCLLDQLEDCCGKCLGGGGGGGGKFIQGLTPGEGGGEWGSADERDAQLDLSGLNEMQEILSMLRQRAKSRGAGSSCSTAADTELDLSSFPSGPR